jgi:hypothetical protein
MLKDPISELTNATSGKSIASDYVNIGQFTGLNFYENSYAVIRQADENSRRANAPQSASEFLQAVALDRRFAEEVVARALGVFDGQLYVWLVIRELNTDLTRSLFELKSAIEQQSHGEFEIHVEPLGHREIEELMPTGFILA